MIVLDSIPLSKSSTIKSDDNSQGETKLTREDILHRISKKRWDMSTGQSIKLPPLDRPDDLVAWVARVEEDLMAEDVMIPRSQWADAAIIYLADYESLNMSMRQQRARRLEAGGSETWLWEDFQASLSQVLEQRECRSGIQSFREDHPITATAVTVAGAGLMAAGGLALAPAIIVGGLNAVGFTASGVAGGSIAAGIQSGVYGGLTTGLFSTCQSIAATWVVGSGSVFSGIGSLYAGATILRSASQKTETNSSAPEPDPDHLAGTRRSTSPPPY